MSTYKPNPQGQPAERGGCENAEAEDRAGDLHIWGPPLAQLGHRGAPPPPPPSPPRPTPCGGRCNGRARERKGEGAEAGGARGPQGGRRVQGPQGWAAGAGGGRAGGGQGEGGGRAGEGRGKDGVGGGRSDMTAVGLEPTPFRNGALIHCLRPLGQTVLTACRRQGYLVHAAARAGRLPSLTPPHPTPPRPAVVRLPHSSILWKEHQAPYGD